MKKHTLIFTNFTLILTTMNCETSKACKKIGICNFAGFQKNDILNILYDSFLMTDTRRRTDSNETTHSASFFRLKNPSLKNTQEITENFACLWRARVGLERKKLEHPHSTFYFA